jgi:hypothetical protein
MLQNQSLSFSLCPEQPATVIEGDLFLCDECIKPIDINIQSDNPFTNLRDVEHNVLDGDNPFTDLLDIENNVSNGDIAFASEHNGLTTDIASASEHNGLNGAVASAIAHNQNGAVASAIAHNQNGAVASAIAHNENGAVASAIAHNENGAVAVNQNNHLNQVVRTGIITKCLEQEGIRCSQCGRMIRYGEFIVSHKMNSKAAVSHAVYLFCINRLF